MSLAAALPSWVKAPLKQARNAALYSGDDVFCNVCSRSFGRWQRFGHHQRAVMCPNCASLERHRLLWLFLQDRQLLRSRPKLLHIAPEKCFERQFRAMLGKGYVTGDLLDPRADVQLDIQDIPYVDESWDAVYCSHVLEHVDDDRKAIREVRRVLKPGGWAILLVPVIAEKTFEDPSVTDPQERLRLFGQEDHVRAYGPDYVDRLRECGFHVETITADHFRKTEQLGLGSGAGEIYFCTR